MKLIKGAKLVDPNSDTSDFLDVLIKGSQIEAVDKPGSFASVEDVQVVDAQGLLLIPGLVDIHVHLRGPGFEWKETIETGAKSAVAGGFTTICCMPNTQPVNDNAEVTSYILGKAKQASFAKVKPIGAITKGLKGEILSPMIELFEAGCVAFSDDGLPVEDSNVI